MEKTSVGRVFWLASIRERWLNLSLGFRVSEKKEINGKLVSFHRRGERSIDSSKVQNASRSSRSNNMSMHQVSKQDIRAIRRYFHDDGYRLELHQKVSEICSSLSKMKNQVNWTRDPPPVRISFSVALQTVCIRESAHRKTHELRPLSAYPWFPFMYEFNVIDRVPMTLPLFGNRVVVILLPDRQIDTYNRSERYLFSTLNWTRRIQYSMNTRCWNFPPNGKIEKNTSLAGASTNIHDQTFRFTSIFSTVFRKGNRFFPRKTRFKMFDRF